MAEYLTVLPPRAELEAKLRQALEAARERLGGEDEGEDTENDERR